jgi:hypothetical protein
MMYRNDVCEESQSCLRKTQKVTSGGHLARENTLDNEKEQVRWADMHEVLIQVGVPTCRQTARASVTLHFMKLCLCVT